jgi:hypothetical protein
MKILFLIGTLLVSVTSYSQVCALQGRSRSEVISVAVVDLNGQKFLRQTSNLRTYQVDSQILASTDNAFFTTHVGLLSAPPFMEGVLFRLKVNKVNPAQSLYQVMGEYRTIKFKTACH